MTHGHEPHSANVSSSTNALRAGVLGANDGIVSVAALLLGVVAAGASDSAVLTAGIAATAAGAVSMALGEYVSVSSQRDSEKVLIEKETRELEEMPEAEHDELTGILVDYGISPDTADKAAREISERDALRAHLRLELGLDAEELTSPVQAAISSAISFLIGAALPLIAALLAPSGAAAVSIAVVTLVALALTGAVSAKLSSASLPRAVGRLVIGGALGLAITYGVGLLFGVAA